MGGNQIQWVLFDLGGVVLTVEQSKIFEELARATGQVITTIKNALTGSQPFWNRFVVSEVSPGELTHHVNQTLGVTLTQETVVAAFNAELGETIHTTAEIIPKLRRKAQVGCLSNTNSIHWDHMLSAYDVMKQFDRRYASQMLGFAKPDPEIYQRVVTQLGIDPGEILFFDDKHENVEAAQRLGWNARVYTGHSGLVSDLESFGLSAGL